MTKMNCKACNKEIDYVKERQPRAYNFGTEVKHVCEGFGQKKNWANKKAIPIEGELELLGKISSVEADVATLKTEVAKQGQAIQALVKQLDVS